MMNKENQEMDSEMNIAVTDNEMENESSKRAVQLTFKAAEAKLLSMQKERNSGIKRLLKMSKELEQMMIANGTVSEVQVQHEVLWKMYDVTTESWGLRLKSIC